MHHVIQNISKKDLPTIEQKQRLARGVGVLVVVRAPLRGVHVPQMLALERRHLFRVWRA